MFFKIFMILVLFQNYHCQNHSSEEVECDEMDADDYLSYDVSTFDTIKFLLISPENETIELNSTNLDLVNKTQPTKILIHGLASFENSKWVDEVAFNYHTKGNYNVIAVDWSVISTNDSLYVVSAVDSVGNVVGNFILEVIQTEVEHLNDIHLIGSSVGAQVGGAAGKAVAKSGKGKVDRITALDPTEPENLEQLDEDDAEFVDVIHTTVGLGERNIGTVDFYVTTDDPETPVCYNDTCGELLGTDYFAQSIVDAYRFYGVSCYNASSYIQKLCDVANNATLGEYVSRNVTGSFLVAKDSAYGLHGQGRYLLGVTIVISLWYSRIL